MLARRRAPPLSLRRPTPGAGSFGTEWSSSPAQGGAVVVSAFAGASAVVGVFAKVADGGTSSPQTSAGVVTQATGSTFVVDVLMTSSSLSGVTDNKGNTYTLHETAANYSGSFDLSRYVCLNGAGGSGHTATITKAGGNETAEVTFFFTEIKNCTAFGGTSVSAVDGSNPVTAPNISVSVSAALLFSAFAGDGFGGGYAMTATSYTGVDAETAPGADRAQGATAYRAVP